MIGLFSRIGISQRYAATTLLGWKALVATSPSSSLYFSTVFQVNPKGETSITDYENELHGTHTSPRQFVSAHVPESIPKDDYYRGHLLHDQLEYVNDTIEKIEYTVSALEELNTRKRSVVTKNIGLLNDSHRNEMKRLFDDSTTRKIELKRQLHDMKAALRSYKESNKNRKSFAVDAPDGLSDADVQNEMNEVQQILHDTPTIQERAAAIQALIVQSRNGVDAPDGTCDAMSMEELEVIQYILNHSKKVSK